MSAAPGKNAITGDLAPGSPDSPSEGSRRRGAPTLQACAACRRSKLKCDGERPKCSRCLGKDTYCEYDGKPGQSKTAAMKSRLRSLEDLFTALRETPSEEAAELLQRIRTTEDALDALSLVTYPSSEFGSTRQPPRNRQRSGSSPSNALPDVGKGLKEDSDMLVRTPFPLKLPDSTFRTPLPTRARTDRAVDEYFSCSGDHFHVFSRDQVNAYLTSSALSPEYDTKAAATCCVSAVAALGSQYLVTEGLEELVWRDSFYAIAKHSLEALVEHNELEAMKVCILMTMYNIVEKSKVALAYVEMGLSIACRYGLENSKRHPAIPHAAWTSYRKAWRSLLFCFTWLASTLGCMPSNGSFGEGVNLVEMEMDMDESSGPIHRVQAELSKISLLTLNILRVDFDFRHLTPGAIDQILSGLQDWYQNLPPTLRLNNLGRGDLSDFMRRSIYYIHVLHLGAIMLLHRRIASQYLREYLLRKDYNAIGHPLEEIIDQIQEGVTAAKHTTSIAVILLRDKPMLRACWIIMFQSFVSCVIILHCAVQKQLHRAPAEINEDLQHAQHTLAVLDYCSKSDAVAAKFHGRLVRMQQAIRNAHHGNRASHSTAATKISPTTSNLSRTMPSASAYLEIPEEADPVLKRLSLQLLTMLCQPFEGIPKRFNPVDDVQDSKDVDMTDEGDSYMAEHLYHDFKAPLLSRGNVSAIDQPSSAGGGIFY